MPVGDILTQGENIEQEYNKNVFLTNKRIIKFIESDTKHLGSEKHVRKFEDIILSDLKTIKFSSSKGKMAKIPILVLGLIAAIYFLSQEDFVIFGFILALTAVVFLATIRKYDNKKITFIGSKNEISCEAQLDEVEKVRNIYFGN